MGGMRLFSGGTDASSRVDLGPQTGVLEERAGLVSTHRSLSGRQVRYAWPSFERAQIPLRYVSSADQTFVEQHWRSGTQMALTLDDGEPLTTLIGRLVDPASPLNMRERPLADRLLGTLAFEADDSRRRQGLPFILDDATHGLLDDTTLALI